MSINEAPNTDGSSASDCYADDGWNDEWTEPTEKGWYLVDAVDGRWNGEVRYRAWGEGSWWIPLPDGWMSSPMGLYRWVGPAYDVFGPSPSGDNPANNA